MPIVLSTGSKTADTPRGPDLKVEWVSKEEIRVSWKHLPDDDNLFLMVTDWHWYYPLTRIWGPSGQETIAYADDTKRVAIVAVDTDVGLQDFNGNVEPDDPRISEIVAQELIPGR